MMSREGVVFPHPNNYSNVLNTSSAPLLQIYEEGRLTKSPHMEYRLALAKIEHVGKNIPTNKQE
jgi:hypothetical protein